MSTRGINTRALRSDAWVLLLCLIAPATATQLSAQADPDSVQLRNDCRLADQVIRTARPANRRAWALGLVPACGTSGVQAVVAQWQSVEATGDSATIVELRRSIYHVQDRLLFDTFMGTVGSSTASARAKVEAWYYLFKQIGRGIILPQAELSVEPMEMLCTFNFSTTAPPLQLSPLPGDYVQLVDAAATRTAAGAGDHRVRRFGKCVHEYVLSLGTLAP